MIKSTLYTYLQSKLSMHQINCIRDCYHCHYCDRTAYEYNESMHKQQEWTKAKPVCRYAFKINWDNETLALICPQHTPICKRCSYPFETCICHLKEEKIQ